MNKQTFCILTIFLVTACSEGSIQPSHEDKNIEPSNTVSKTEFVLSYDIVGDYICTISEEAGIASSHVANSGPPKAFSVNSNSWKFKMRITQEVGKMPQYRMIELPYTAPDRNQVEWHTENSVLHSPYIGDGIEFVALEDQGFVRFHKTIHQNEHGNMSFNHAGFAWAGGEDGRLLARWGRCKLID